MVISVLFVAASALASGETTDEPAPSRREVLQTSGRLSGLEVAAGVGSAFTLSRDGGEIAELAGPARPTIMPDLAVGWYLADLDATVRLAYRPIRQHASGQLGTERHWRRRALGVEAIKMLGDIHGVAPFVGPAVSHNWLQYSDSLLGDPVGAKRVTPELVVGWDIRPSDAHAFVLRSNLRWAPLLAQGATRYHHLELNLVQLVVYPQRLW